MRTNTLWFESFTRSRHQLSFTYGIDDLRFENAYWYNDVDLIALEAQFGQALLDKIYFHIMAFEINKLISLQPQTIDLGDFAPFHTIAFETLWRKINRKVWGHPDRIVKIGKNTFVHIIFHAKAFCKAHTFVKNSLAHIEANCCTLEITIDHSRFVVLISS